MASAALACASDDSETQQPQESEDAGSTHEDELTPEAAAARDEAANPGSAAVMRFDGKWAGTTSQDQPVSLKVLNRFVAHIEVGYTLDGDDCKADPAVVKLSAMLGIRMGGFTFTNTTEREKLVISGKFTADAASEGEYSVELAGDAPEGCSNAVSGTWTASK